jgi:hypothetical protein
MRPFGLCPTEESAVEVEVNDDPERVGGDICGE